MFKMIFNVVVTSFQKAGAQRLRPLSPVGCGLKLLADRSELSQCRGKIITRAVIRYDTVHTVINFFCDQLLFDSELCHERR